MTDFAQLLLPDRGEPGRTIHTVTKAGFEAWLGNQPERVRMLIAAARFRAKPGEFVILPDERGKEWSVLLGTPETLGTWDLASAAAKLPDGSYRLDDRDSGAAALGWLLAQHRFDRYRQKPGPLCKRVLLSREPAKIEETLALAEAVALVRDLVDTPTSDMGPADLQAAIEQVAGAHGARVRVTTGEALAEGYPMIHAVGRAAAPDRAPRLIEVEWGDPAHPRVAIVGKGVCFDSGGLDIKPASGMRLMKKDMGGAAHALALAGLVMRAKLPVRLHLLVPAVENAISGDAFRPGDVLSTRKGLFVEIGNTDAEGRLILGDALVRAGEDKPELVLDFATLTGAARVALGPELPALFANEDGLGDELLAAGSAVEDPLWRLPLWSGYKGMLKSDVADINNAGEGGFAGAITAALFLAEFAPDGVPWAHFDTSAWRPAGKPGRPKGGEALGLRAAWEMLQRRFGEARPDR
ncbi:MAG: leucyl aminopeptidase family protein [Sphingomonadaceae bacterium]|nr:leucyl aminopeptidase family protein [Sphingomonadaceae bacterium]